MSASSRTPGPAHANCGRAQGRLSQDQGRRAEIARRPRRRNRPLRRSCRWRTSISCARCCPSRRIVTMSCHRLSFSGSWYELSHLTAAHLHHLRAIRARSARAFRTALGAKVANPTRLRDHRRRRFHARRAGSFHCLLKHGVVTLVFNNNAYVRRDAAHPLRTAVVAADLRQPRISSNSRNPFGVQSLSLHRIISSRRWKRRWRMAGLL